MGSCYITQGTQPGALWWPRGLGWGMWWEGVSRGRVNMCAYWLIHVFVWQHCKAVIFKLKVNLNNIWANNISKFICLRQFEEFYFQLKVSKLQLIFLHLSWLYTSMLLSYKHPLWLLNTYKPSLYENDAHDWFHIYLLSFLFFLYTHPLCWLCWATYLLPIDHLFLELSCVCSYSSDYCCNLLCCTHLYI